MYHHRCRLASLRKSDRPSLAAAVAQRYRPAVRIQNRQVLKLIVNRCGRFSAALQGNAVRRGYCNVRRLHLVSRFLGNRTLFRRQCQTVTADDSRLQLNIASQRLQIHFSACRDVIFTEKFRLADYGHIPRSLQCFVIINRTAFRNQFDAATAFHRNAFLNTASRQNAVTCIFYIAFQRLQQNLMSDIIAAAHNNIAAVADGTLTPQHHVSLCRVQLACVRHRAIIRMQADATAFRFVVCFRDDVTAVRYARLPVQGHLAVRCRHSCRIRNSAIFRSYRYTAACNGFPVR